MRHAFACLALVLAAAGPVAAADITTYAGTLGTLPIIVEISDADAQGAVFGRYSYLSKGGDIPLHGKQSKAGKLMLAEEKPCTEKLCRKGEDIVDTAPVGAEWVLKVEGDGLAGSWTDKDSGKTLEVKLKYEAERPVPADVTGLDMLDPLYVNAEGTPPTLSPRALPYDFLKLDRPAVEGELKTSGNVTYRFDTDKRTDLPYPVIVTLGDADPTPLNAYLRQQRLQFSLPVFSCLSRAYLGFGWTGSPGEGGKGYDGGATVNIDHLTPRLMGYTESGSFFCGGAHPDNSIIHRTVDARTGQPLVAERLLKGWRAMDADGKPVDPSTFDDPDLLTFGPDPELEAFVRSHINRSIDAAHRQECGMDDLVRTNLAVYFTRDDLVFTFRDLPHVIMACTEDLVKVPPRDARPLLTEQGTRYFAELD